MKLTDYPKLEEFLNNEIIATLAVPIDESGTIHAAALHYWYSPKPLQFYFITNHNSEKCTLLKRKKNVKAACVVGTVIGVPCTLQMRGRLSIVNPDEYQDIIKVYDKKHPKQASDDLKNPENVLLQFTPTWARFTDYATGYNQHFLDLP